MQQDKARKWPKRRNRGGGAPRSRNRKTLAHVIDEMLGLQDSHVSTLVSLYYAQASRFLQKTSVERNTDEYQIFLDRLCLLA